MSQNSGCKQTHEHLRTRYAVQSSLLVRFKACTSKSENAAEKGADLGHPQDSSLPKGCTLLGGAGLLPDHSEERAGLRLRTGRWHATSTAVWTAPSLCPNPPQTCPHSHHLLALTLRKTGYPGSTVYVMSFRPQVVCSSIW